MDQNFRTLLFSELIKTKSASLAAAFKIKKSDVSSYMIKQIPILDSLNLIRVEHIIKQFGYPGLSLVGAETNNAAYYVILDSSKFHHYLPVIRQTAEKNEIEFQLPAMMLVRSLMYNEEEQIFGIKRERF